MNRWDDFISELDKEAHEILTKPVENIKESVYHHFGYDYNPFDPLLPLKNPDSYLPIEDLFKWLVKNILVQVKLLTRNDLPSVSMASSENHLVVGPTGQGKTTFLLMMALALDKLESLKKVGTITTLVLPIRGWKDDDPVISDLKEQLKERTENVHVLTSLQELESLISSQEESTDAWLLFIDDVHLLLKPSGNVPPLNALASLFFKPFLAIGAIPLGFYLYLTDFITRLTKESLSPHLQHFVGFFNGISVLMPPLSVEQLKSFLNLRFASTDLSREIVSKTIISFLANICFGNPRLALDILFRSFLVSRRLERDVIKDDAVEAALHQLGISRIKDIHALLASTVDSIDELKPLLGKRTLLLEILLYNNYLSELHENKETSDQWGRQIAKLLKISPSTLSYHMKTLMEFSERYFPLVKEKTDPHDHRAKIVTVNENLLPLVESLLLVLKGHEKEGLHFSQNSEDSIIILPPISSSGNVHSS